MLALLIALDLSACAGYPEQRNGSRALAALYVAVAVAAGRTIGAWFGLIYCRWSLVGAFVFGTAQIGTAAIAILAVADASAGSAMGRCFTALGAAGMTTVSAALVVALLAGCYATLRSAPSDQ
jgi:Kef-type K+ transport system membrane component KefB